MANTDPADRIPSPELAEAVRSMVSRDGLAATQKTLNLSRPTVLSLMARTGSQPGTIALAEQRIARAPR